VQLGVFVGDHPGDDFGIWTASSSMAGGTTIILAGALTHDFCY
jgi:hypothetical protein